MTTKPDRFERMISKYANRGMPDYDEFVLADHEVIKLLRKEHRAIVRMVQKESKTDGAGGFYDGYVCACIAILTKLNERAK